MMMIKLKKSDYPLLESSIPDVQETTGGYYHISVLVMTLLGIAEDQERRLQELEKERVKI